MQQTPAARARGISKYYSDIVALDRVDLDVEAGQVHGLVGPNGAGKTTLLGLLLGVATADAGTLEILGRPVERSLAVADGVAGFVDGPGLYPSLTARQNLTAVATLRGIRHGRADRVGDALEQAGLVDVADARVRGYSLGMRQRLGLAAALLTRPRLLVLDEPANGLDPAGERHVHRLINQLTDDGVAVVLSSHRMDDLASLCGDVTILVTGRVVFSGPVEKLAAESGVLDYRLLTTDSARARTIASDTPGIRLDKPVGGRSHADVLVLSGPVSALDTLVARLVLAGVAVRELAPVVTPLEAAFLALTDHHEDDEEPGGAA
ncbi:ABC transporter ATP-binding protein [soil metagenome]